MAFIITRMFAALGAVALIAAASPPTKAILVQDYAFHDPTVTVVPGTVVVWTNRDDDPHTVTANDGSFDSGGLGQGDTFKHTFGKPGRYPYHCAAHPFMKGVVIVKGDAAP